MKKGRFLFVLGAQKAGTTTLADILRNDDRFFVPSIKETYFFNLESFHERGARWFLDEFYSAAPAGRDWWVEATPSYIMSDPVMRRIEAFSDPEDRFIVLLREPVSRAYSSYWHQQRLGHESLSFGEALRAESDRSETGEERWWRFAYRAGSSYPDRLRSAFEIFGRDRVLVLVQELLRDPAALTSRLERHLGLNGPLDCNVRVSNASSMPRSRLLQRIVVGNSIAKNLLRAAIPRELRTRIGRRLIDMNLKQVRYPPISEIDEKELAELFRDELRVTENLLADDDVVARTVKSWRERYGE